MKHEDPSRGFAPLAGSGAKLLILGSLPGQRSIAAGEYYAHPQNAFWRIMGALFDAGPEHPYPLRAERLRRAGVAVWDVLESSVRAGSMDAAIEDATAVPNDFAVFMGRYPRIGRICFNGRKAAELFERRVLPGMPDGVCPARVTLPSTSPAYAAMSFEDKLARWARGLDRADRDLLRAAVD